MRQEWLREAALKRQSQIEYTKSREQEILAMRRNNVSELIHHKEDQLSSFKQRRSEEMHRKSLENQRRKERYDSQLAQYNEQSNQRTN